MFKYATSNDSSAHYGREAIESVLGVADVRNADVGDLRERLRVGYSPRRDTKKADDAGAASDARLEYPLPCAGGQSMIRASANRQQIHALVSQSKVLLADLKPLCPASACSGRECEASIALLQSEVDAALSELSREPNNAYLKALFDSAIAHLDELGRTGGFEHGNVRSQDDIDRMVDYTVLRSTLKTAHTLISHDERAAYARKLERIGCAIERVQEQASVVSAALSRARGPDAYIGSSMVPLHRGEIERPGRDEEAISFSGLLTLVGVETRRWREAIASGRDGIDAIKEFTAYTSDVIENIVAMPTGKQKYWSAYQHALFDVDDDETVRTDIGEQVFELSQGLRSLDQMISPGSDKGGPGKGTRRGKKASDIPSDDKQPMK